MARDRAHLIAEHEPRPGHLGKIKAREIKNHESNTREI
jgi:hypothetical protein